MIIFLLKGRPLNSCLLNVSPNALCHAVDTVAGCEKHTPAHCARCPFDFTPGGHAVNYAFLTLLKKILWHWHAPVQRARRTSQRSPTLDRFTEEPFISIFILTIQHCCEPILKMTEICGQKNANQTKNLALSWIKWMAGRFQNQTKANAISVSHIECLQLFKSANSLEAVVVLSHGQILISHFFTLTPPSFPKLWSMSDDCSKAAARRPLWI